MQSPGNIDPVRIARPFNSEEIERDVLAILRSGRLVQGEKVKEFESSLARYLGCEFVIATNSGTSALHSAIFSAKLLAEDHHRNEVITSPLSFAATANAVIHAGCFPVFADVDLETFNLDPSLAEDKINDRTLAIEPVDAFGLPAELDKFSGMARKSDLAVVEDAAEAIGAYYQGKRVGVISSLTCFSTYATKNLHTAEGGFVTTNNERYAEELRRFRNQGQSARYNQTQLGYNFRMLEICAAIGLHQLPLLDEMNRKRRDNSLFLRKELSEIDCLSFQQVHDPSTHAWYMCAMLLDESKSPLRRNVLVHKLREEGIEADVAWPLPIHLQPYFEETLRLPVGSFPNAEKICNQILQLPIHPFLEHEDLERVVRTVKKLLSAG